MQFSTFELFLITSALHFISPPFCCFLHDSTSRNRSFASLALVHSIHRLNLTIKRMYVCVRLCFVGSFETLERFTVCVHFIHRRVLAAYGRASRALCVSPTRVRPNYVRCVLRVKLPSIETFTVLRNRPTGA